MKMDDTFESEIISDIFTTHFQLIKKYFTLIQMNLLNIFILGPDETLQSKLLKPAPFMILMLLLIIISIAIQSNRWLRKYLCNLHNALTPGFAIGNKIGSFSENSVLNNLGQNMQDFQVTQEVQEGLVGVYAMQGRRGNMEDRFSIMQDVQVGPNKTMSFIGVFDGHGGQFVAEYLRLNLFKNTIEKIKQLRTSMNSNGIVTKDGKVSRDKVVKSKVSFDTNSANKSSLSYSESNKTLTDDQSCPGSKEEQLDDLSTNTTDVSTEKNTKNKVNEDIKTTTDETIYDKSCPKKDEEKNYENETPLKKDDAYNTLNIRRKSLANIHASMKESKDEPSNDDNLYVDMNKNINYTKLLTDQMLNIDSQIVEQCVSNQNLSGSTAVVALIDGELLIVANVGDSRAVMADDKGRAVPLSFDHKPNQLKERRRIKDAGGFVTFTGVWRVAGILATSRAMGDFPLKRPRPLITAEPDVLTFSLIDHKAEFVILASDGLWDVMSNEEVVTFVRSRLNEKDFGAKSLSLHAHDLGSQDNITAAVINFTKMVKTR